MFTSGSTNVHRGVSAVVAAAIVGISGLAFDRGHMGSATGEIAIAETLAPSDVLPGVAMLPEVTVTASRLAMSARRTKG